MRRLEATGPSEDQAEAITTAIRDADLTSLVTKPDLAEAKFDITKQVAGSIGFRTILIVGAIVALSHAPRRRPAQPLTRTAPAAAPPPRG